MVRIGLTGGIGSGKSTVAGMLAERGAAVIDADQIARELVEPGEPALHLLVDEFGDSIIAPDGSLLRGRLAALAFASPDGTARLNAVMHPLISAESRRRLDRAVEAGATVVVYDMPLLVETGQGELVDLIVVVDVAVEVQVARAVSRGLDEADVRRRIEVQASREERRAAADVVIDTSGSIEDTRAQVDRLWQSLTSPPGVFHPESR